MSEYQSEQIGELAKALAAAQGAMDAAKKDSKGNYGKYTTISSILEVVKDAMSANGLAVAQILLPADPGFIRLRTTLIHSSGQWLASELSMKAEAPGPQKIGSVITYARRYSLAAMLGVGQEDDDAQSAQDYVESHQKQQIRHDRRTQPAKEPRNETLAKGTPVDTVSQTMRKLFAVLAENGLKEKDAALAELSKFFGREITSRADLTDNEALDYINAVQEKFPEDCPY